jgi:hypothetical protein
MNNFQTNYYSVIAQEGLLKVIFIPKYLIPKCAWWVMRSILENESVDHFNAPFSSFLLDSGGMSVVCNAALTLSLCCLVDASELTLSSENWCALIINLTGNEYEFPGAVAYLSGTLSEHNISIFHLSTFDSEVFLVQEPDFEKAKQILRDAGDPVKVASLLHRAATIISPPRGNRQEEVVRNSSEAAAESLEQDQVSDANIESWISAEQSFVAETQEQFLLEALPRQLLLARRNTGFGSSNPQTRTQFSTILVGAHLIRYLFSQTLMRIFNHYFFVLDEAAFV